MKLFAISILMLWVAVAFADQPVTFFGSDQDFAVVPTATGSVRNDGAFLTVTLDRFTIRISDKFKSPAHVVGYRVSLVKPLSGGQWEVARTSATVPTNFSLLPGQTHSIAAYKAEIPIDGLASLRGCWLAIAVDDDSSGRVGTVYAHSQNWKAP